MDDIEDAGPITVVISRRVRPGRHADYERWVRDISAVVKQFPGHDGMSVLRPGGVESSDYVVVLRFASYEDVRRWERSEERQRFLARLEPLTFDEGAWQQQTGLETWFTLPGRPVPAGPPRRWKMALLTTVALYPLLVVTDALVGSRLVGLSFVVRTALTTPVLVAIMTWVLMPLVTRVAYGWLYPQASVPTSPTQGAAS